MPAGSCVCLRCTKWNGSGRSGCSGIKALCAAPRIPVRSGRFC